MPARQLLGRSIEQLEQRLAATAGPAVLEVLLSSTAWSSTFLSFLNSEGLGTQGYSIPDGANQTKPVPWNNINQIKIVFDRDVLVNANDLAITGVNVTQYQIGSFAYDADHYVATWTLASSFGRDRILLDLDANGLDPVRDLAGNILDGEWQNGVSSISGNGVAGGDFQFLFNVLPGDVNQSGSVLNNDVVSVQNALFKSAGQAGYSAFLDLNGSGSILSNDVVVVQNNQFTSLPSGNPAGVSNDAPTAAAMPHLVIAANNGPVSVNLRALFSDLETNSADLQYQVTANTNASLISTNINSSSDALTITVASGQIGTAELNLRASDGQLGVDAKLKITVSAPPVIDSVLVTLNSENEWIFSGRVLDESPTNATVHFGGLLEGQSTVPTANGQFTYTAPLSMYAFGEVTLQATDMYGLTSNMVTERLGLG